MIFADLCNGIYSEVICGNPEAVGALNEIFNIYFGNDRVSTFEFPPRLRLILHLDMELTATNFFGFLDFFLVRC